MHKRTEEAVSGLTVSAQDGADATSASEGPLAALFKKALPMLAMGLVVLVKLGNKFDEDRALVSRLVKLGWFPSIVTPFEIMHSTLDDSDADAAIARFFTERWVDVREAILAHIAPLNIDDDAKAAIREALDAHEARLYRCVPPLMFAEIERVTRSYIPDEDWKHIKDHLNPAIDNIGALGFIINGHFSLANIEFFKGYIYETVTTDNLDKWRGIPNRHATMHGRVVYKTQKESLNAIAIALTAFAVISDNRAGGAGMP